MDAAVKARRTYWHLEELQRKPSDYEIASSRLLYHPQRGFEVATPIADWYRRYQRGSRFQCDDWERFADPRATTYTAYVTQRHESELVIDQLLRAIDDTGYDARLDPAWLATLQRWLPVLRYPIHGLQMAAAYVAQMAPASRITICALMQCGDECRRVQRLAYRLRQLQQTHGPFGAEARRDWEQDAAWQGLRARIEQLLVTWDWGEAFVDLNLVLKPALDALFMEAWAQQARAAGDDRLEGLLYALNQDCRWHREWSAAVVRCALAQQTGLSDFVAARVDAQLPAAVRALQPLLPPGVEPSLLEQACLAQRAAALG